MTRRIAQNFNERYENCAYASVIYYEQNFATVSNKIDEEIDE